MLLLIEDKISDKDLKKVAEDFDGYVKVVVDVDREILTAGGKQHVEGEELLLQGGSRQDNLWGGGLDLETGEIDFDSMINLRPNQDNSSREVLNQKLREKITEIVQKLLV
ncbi:MAG: DUF5674 family protein [Candidatus Woykebacteria bacterium]